MCQITALRHIKLIAASRKGVQRTSTAVHYQQLTHHQLKLIYEMASIESELAEFQEWVKKELPNCRKDLTYLRKFLIGCKMRQDEARKKLRNLQNLIDDTPEWFEKRDPDDAKISSLLDLGVFMPLPDKDEDGRTIVVVRAAIYNYNTHHINDVFKVGMMVLDAALEKDDCIVEKGVVAIIDINKVSVGHVFQLTPTAIKKAVHSWQDCYPVRIKSILFVNCPYMVSTILNVFRTFMREKLKRRMRTFNKGELKNLNVPAELLPVEYGGTCGTIETSVKYWRDYTKAKRQWYLNAGNDLP